MHRADGGRSSSDRLDLSTNLCPMCPVTLTKEREQNDVLEFAEISAFYYNVYNLYYIGASVKPRLTLSIIPHLLQRTRLCDRGRVAK